MGKKSEGETVTQSLDPQAKAYRDKVYGAAGNAAQQPLTQYGGQTTAGASDLSVDAAEGYQHGAGLFGLGVDAMGGDAEAFKHFQNPYQTNVLDAVTRQTGEAARHARMDIGDQAALAGAFGGDRHGVAEGVATGDIMNRGGDRMADLTYQGFNDANQRAYQAANLGMTSLGNSAQMGDYFRRIQQQYLDKEEGRFNEARDWDVRNLGILQSGMTGVPTGSATTTPSASNPMMGAAGGAMSGFAAGGPPGAIVGGLIGAYS